MKRVRVLRVVATVLVSLAMLHAAADALQACGHDAPPDAAIQTADAHAGHHGSPEQAPAAPCDDALQCCLVAPSCVFEDVPTIMSTDRPFTRIVSRVDAEPRSLVLPPDPPPPRA